jgi:hypothetical protein
MGFQQAQSRVLRSCARLKTSRTADAAFDEMPSHSTLQCNRLLRLRTNFARSIRT